MTNLQNIEWVKESFLFWSEQIKKHKDKNTLWNYNTIKEIAIQHGLVKS